MPVIGLLEGQRLRYRLGDPFITPEAWDANENNRYRQVDREKNTTDWSRLWLDNQANAKSQYDIANGRSLDPDQYPTLESWLAAHGGIPSTQTQTPANNDAANAAYAAWAAEQAAEAARLAKLPRDPVIGPAFLPDPPAMPDCTGRSGEVTCYDPSKDAQGGRAPEGSPADAALSGAGKSSLLPLLALAAAWMVLK